jgi:hypothetical protein
MTNAAVPSVSVVIPSFTEEGNVERVAVDALKVLVGPRWERRRMRNLRFGFGGVQADDDSARAGGHSVQRAVRGVKYRLRVSALRYRPMTTYVFLAK